MIIKQTHPNINFWTGILLPFEDLRRGVRRTSAPRLEQLTGRIEVAKTEIGYLDI
jgi:hypothetical protein